MYKYSTNVAKLIDEIMGENVFKENSSTFYKGRINNFFSDYMGLPVHESKPLNAITYYDVDTFIKNLKNSDAEKSNHYSALKLFFDYTYSKGITSDIIRQVTKPVSHRKPKVILKEDEYANLKSFIFNSKNSLVERLTLGLFLFTGLSRKYIASLKYNQFIYDEGVYKLLIYKDKEQVKLPLKSELQLLVHEYRTSLPIDNDFDNVMQMDENSISTYIGNLTKSIIGKKCTPTILSNTFISKALSSGNYIWEVSKLTLESVSTIEQHIVDMNDLVNKQTAILNSF